MKKVDINKLTESFNRYRMENPNKTFSYQEMIEILRSLGFNTNISGLIISHGYVNSERVGNSYLYSFTNNPIHKSQISALYEHTRRIANKKNRNSQANEQSALELLQSKGYQIRKVKGFDLERFQKENPELYKKYLIYEQL